VGETSAGCPASITGGSAQGASPAAKDLQKEQLQSRVQELEKKVRLYEEREELRALIKQMEEPDDAGSSTKKNSK